MSDSEQPELTEEATEALGEPTDTATPRDLRDSARDDDVKQVAEELGDLGADVFADIDPDDLTSGECLVTLQVKVRAWDPISCVEAALGSFITEGMGDYAYIVQDVNVDDKIWVVREGEVLNEQQIDELKRGTDEPVQALDLR